MELTQTKLYQKTKKSHILYGLLGFALGVAPMAGGIMPFGLALLCAMPKKGRRELFFGVLAASLFDACMPLYAFCASYLYFVLAWQEKSGRIYLYVRMLLSFSVSALQGAYMALTGVSDISQTVGLLAAVLSYPLFTYAFFGYFDKKREIRKTHYDISLLAFALALSLSVSRLYINGISLSVIPAAVFTLWGARAKGFGFGCGCGIICGLAAGGGVCGALGVMGLTYGLLATEIEPLALALSYMLGVSGYFYLAGVDGFVTAAIMFLAVYIGFIPFKNKIKLYSHGETGCEKRAYDRKLARYAATFSSLSSLFYTVSHTTKEESITDLNSRIEETVSYHCNRCQGCELDKSEISNFFTREYRRCGAIAYSRIPTHITSRCVNAPKMARAVNNLATQRQNQGEQGLKQMADQYSEISSILIEGAKKQEDRHRTDNKMGQEIRAALQEIGICCDGVKVSGQRMRSITVYGVNPKQINCSPNSISDAVSAVTRTKITPPELVIHDDYVLMKLSTAPALRIECAKISETKNGEPVCGDTVSVFENDDRYFYCLVSDGMGSGRDAALTSRLSSIMLEKLLTVGAEKESALRLLNKTLVEKDDEIFATVDLLEIDRVLSTATLIKAGAAPTLLIRKGESVKLESKTPPAGIMDKVIADKKTFNLEKGDMVVMLSDGILQTGSEESILPPKGIPPMPSARALAGKIMRQAQQSDISDDMSVCVLRIY